MALRHANVARQLPQHDRLAVPAVPDEAQLPYYPDGAYLTHQLLAIVRALWTGRVCQRRQVNNILLLALGA